MRYKGIGTTKQILCKLLQTISPRKNEFLPSLGNDNYQIARENTLPIPLFLHGFYIGKNVLTSLLVVLFLKFFIIGTNRLHVTLMIQHVDPPIATKAFAGETNVSAAGICLYIARDAVFSFQIEIASGTCNNGLTYRGLGIHTRQTGNGVIL